MKKLAALAILAGLVIFARDTRAGIRSVVPVSIDLEHRTATGSAGSARNSADVVQTIGCSASAGDANFMVLTCFARDADSNVLAYTTYQSNFLNVAGTINSDSTISFEVDELGFCSF